MQKLLKLIPPNFIPGFVTDFFETARTPNSALAYELIVFIL